MANTVSAKTQSDALKMANAHKKPGQTKEQTKLIAQGIEKGIAEYKKQQKAHARARDKLRKKEAKQSELTNATGDEISPPQKTQRLPWLLLVLSWLCFLGYIVLL